MIRIPIYSYDGGCGKTTTAINLARHLSNSGLSVLCIDLDAKASLTSRIGLSEFQKRLVNTGMSIASVLSGENQPGEATVKITEHLHIIGTEIPGDGIDTTLPAVASRLQAKSPNHNRLHRALSQVDNLFDVCLIDCQPVADVLAVNVIYAADYVICPVRLDEESVNDVRNVARMIAEISDLTDRKPKLAGVILTQTNPQTRLYKRTWPQVEALGVPVLGEVRMFTGMDAGKQIFESYGVIAEKVAEIAKEGKANA